MRSFEKASEVLVEVARNRELERRARLHAVKDKYIQSVFNKSAVTKAGLVVLNKLAFFVS